MSAREESTVNPELLHKEGHNPDLVESPGLVCNFRELKDGVVQSTGLHDCFCGVTSNDATLHCTRASAALSLSFLLPKMGIIRRMCRSGE